MRAKIKIKKVWMLMAMVIIVISLLTAGGFAVFAEQTTSDDASDAQDNQIKLIEPFKQSDNPEDIQLQTQSATRYVEIPAEFDYGSVPNMYAAINSERAKVGKAPLRVNRKAVDFAMERAVEALILFDHLSPNGIYRFAYEKPFNGENIAMGMGSSVSINLLQKTLVDSPGHYANMIDSGYHAMGVGYVSTENASTAVQIFESDAQSRDDGLPSGKISKVVPVYFKPSFCNVKTCFTNTNGVKLLDLGLKKGENQRLQLRAYATQGNSDFNISFIYTKTKASFSSSNQNVARVDQNGNVTAVGAGTATITATTGTESNSIPITVTAKQETPAPTTKPTVSPTPTPVIKGQHVVYRTHVQNVGWQPYVTSGTISGTTGQSLRLEGMNIKLVNQKYKGDIEYRTHIQNIGWESSWKKNNKFSGTSGQSLRLEAMQVRLTGEMAKKYDVYYRVHAQNFGWMNWAKNGAKAGTEGFAYRLEGMQIVLVQKGKSLPGIKPANQDDRAFVVSGNQNIHPRNLIAYQTHVQNIGWQPYMVDGVTAGTSGLSYRLEVMRVKLNQPKYSGNIEYRTHIQNIGWESGWKQNGKISGTSGKSLRLEAMQVRLTGEMAKQYDIYYRVHAQNSGWLNWAKNGASAGTEGFAYRLEAMQIVLIPKGKSLPSYSPANNRSEAFIKKTKAFAISMAKAQGYDQIYEGTLRFCNSVSSVNQLFPQNLTYGYPLPYRLPYAVLCLDKYENITATVHDYGRPLWTHSANHINLANNINNWRAYHGKRIVVGFRSINADWPSQANVLWETCSAHDAVVIWNN